MKGKQIIEEVFDTVLSTKHPYHTQVNDLDVAGDLGSRKKLATVMFRLAQFVDDLETRLNVLEARFAPLQTMTDGFAQVGSPAPEPVVTPTPEVPASPVVTEPTPVAPEPVVQSTPAQEPIPVAEVPATPPTVDEVTTPTQPNPDPAVQS